MLEERNGQASGRVGFIDFGIVGRVSPGTWMAVEALLTSVATRDFDTMARALVTVGATSTDVDIKVPSIARTTPACQVSISAELPSYRTAVRYTVLHVVVVHCRLPGLVYQELNVEGSIEISRAALLAAAEFVIYRPNASCTAHFLRYILTNWLGMQAFAADLERLYGGFSSLDAEVVVTASRSGEAMAASLNLDDAQINRLLLQV